MAKLKSVTLEQIKELEARAQDLQGDVAEAYRRASQGYADEFAEPLGFASSFASASRTMADLSSWFLMKGALVEQERELHATLSARLAEKSE